jgi:hypothetical protein
VADSLCLSIIYWDPRHPHRWDSLLKISDTLQNPVHVVSDPTMFSVLILEPFFPLCTVELAVDHPARWGNVFGDLGKPSQLRFRDYLIDTFTSVSVKGWAPVL